MPESPNLLTPMSPLKNTDKYLSDYLPPALVKDWRQCFRSRSSVALFILLELAGWLIFGCMVADADQTPSGYLEQMEDMGRMFYVLGVFALCLIIPFRAGSTVAADTRERGSNFLMLTPLSARRIVWGTWSSTALIVLLAALLALPLLAARQLMITAYPHVGELKPASFNYVGFVVNILVLFWLVIVGWVMAGFYMFTSMLPRLLRVVLLIVCGAAALGMMEARTLEDIFGVERHGLENATQLSGILPLGLSVLDALLLLVLFLELARRHYAAPAENCSRTVRLLAPLPLLIGGLLALASYAGIDFQVGLAGQFSFALFYLMAALLPDALLPAYTMPSHSWRLWPVVPAWLQKPGFVPSTLCLAGAVLLFRLPELVGALLTQPDLTTTYGLRLAQASLNTAFTVMLWLLITDCFCRRSAAKRPLVFGVVALACYLAAQCVKMPLGDESLWTTVLPLCEAETYLDDHLNDLPLAQLPTACYLNGGAFLLTLALLLFWRARVNKG